MIKQFLRRNSISNESLLLATNLPVLSGPQTSTVNLLLLWFHRENHLLLERNRTEQSKTRCSEGPGKGYVRIMSMFIGWFSSFLPAFSTSLYIYISVSFLLIFFFCLERDTTMEAKSMFSWLFKRESDHWGNDEGNEFPIHIRSFWLPFCSPSRETGRRVKWKRILPNALKRKGRARTGKEAHGGRLVCVCACVGGTG